MKKLVSLLLALCLCLSVGVMLVSCDDDEHTHTYKTEWSKDATHHWHACETEGCAEASDKAEHAWDEGVVTTAATAEADGVKTYTCSVCGQTKTEAITADGTPVTPPPAALTEAEIFQYIKDAITATKAYDGSITLTAGSTETEKSGVGADEETDTEISTMIHSYDSANKVWYEEESEVYSGDTYTFYTKTFLQGETLYAMERMAAASGTPAAEEEYFRIHDAAKVEYQAIDYEEYFSGILDLDKAICLAASVAELKSALEASLPALMMNTLDGVPTVTVTVTAAEAEGVYSFLVAFAASCEETEVGVKSVTEISLSMTVLAKDGKLSVSDMTMEMMQKLYTGETLTAQGGEKYENDMEITYAFAQDKYDALVVTLPTDPNDIGVEGAPAEDYDDIKVEVYVNGYLSETANFYDVENQEQAIQRIIGCVGFDTSNVDIRVYKDAQFTQELTASTPKADFLALENVYLSVTPHTGYALVKESDAQRVEYSKNFQIGAAILELVGIGNRHAVSYGGFACREVATELALKQNAVQNAQYDIWINGVKQTTKPATLTLVSGLTYFIEYVKVVTDPAIPAA